MLVAVDDRLRGPRRREPSIRLPSRSATASSKVIPFAIRRLKVLEINPCVRACLAIESELRSGVVSARSSDHPQRLIRARTVSGLIPCFRANDAIVVFIIIARSALMSSSFSPFAVNRR